MSIVAYGSNVIVQIPTTQGGGKTRGGLYIPETTGATGNQVVAGKIVSVGPTVGIGPWNGVRLEKRCTPTAGENIWFQKPNSIEFEYEDQTYQVIPENAILAITNDGIAELPA